jgi:endonuclease YncB( thermonuclease family)
VRRRGLPIVLLLALAGAIAVTATASKRTLDKQSARVVGIPSGDSLLVKIGKAKKASRIHVLGVHTPAGSSCYAPQALAETRGLLAAKQVTLVGDVKNGEYVSLANGQDLGLALIQRGAAEVDHWSKTFARLPQYAGAQEDAERGGTGMWRACAADIEVSMSGPDSGFPGQNLQYDVAVKNDGPLAAKTVKLFLRPGAYQETLASAKTPDGAACAQQTWMAVCTLQDIPAGTTVHVAAVMRGSKFGIMSGRAEAALVGCVDAHCGDAPLLDPNLDSNRAAVITLLPGGGYERACEKSYVGVCIPLPPPDLDCEDFLPLRNFPVDHSLPNSDPHNLDGNGNGIACEAEDY